MRGSLFHSRFGRNLGGGDTSVFPNTGLTFWAPFADQGSGAVDLTLARGQGSATFTRATAGWAKLSSGLWASVGTGVARSHYIGNSTAVGAYGGYLAEGQRTNLCLQSRDLSTTWTALNATLLKDQVGIDGVTNSASSMLATAINASCLQTITEAATLSALSLFIKRITGTGTITIQQGATTLDVTAQVNSSTYTRVELDATVLNPAIGIVLGTSGDKIAVDMVQFENGGFASTPIPTTTVAVARNADVLTYPFAGNANASTGTSYAEVMQESNTQGSVINFGASGANATLFCGTEIDCNINDGTNGVNVTGLSSVLTGVRKRATSWGAIGIVACGDGATPSSNSFDGAMANTSVAIGCGTGGFANLFGTIKNVRIWQMQHSNLRFQGMTR